MFGGPKAWADRVVAPKACRECGDVFQPTCGGNLYCKACAHSTRKRNHRVGTRTWRAKNPERHARYKANFDLKRFGLTLDAYERMVDDRFGACDICGCVPKGGRGVLRKLVVDHCHSTDRVRGLLCSACNTAIGLLRDDASILGRAIIYLTRTTDERPR